MMVLTFEQFRSLQETSFNPDEYEIGFLRPGSSPLRSTTTTRHNNRDIASTHHDTLAKQHGYKGTTDALKRGLVRYYHEKIGKQRSAGYEFHDSHENREHVAAHLGRSGEFHNVTLDIHTPQKKVGNATFPAVRKTHEFQDANAAQSHLEN